MNNMMGNMLGGLGGMSSGGSNGGNNILPSMDSKMHNMSLMQSMMSIGGKPTSMNLMPPFDDPVEQSLASLEQSNSKIDMDGMSHMDLMDMNALISKNAQHQSLMQQLGFDSMHHGTHDGSNNGFNLDPTLNLNGIGGVPVPGSGMMLSMPPMSLPNSISQTGPMPSMFDPITTLSRSGMGSSNSMPPTSVGGGNGISNPSTASGGFRPKPIEELMMPSHEKKTPTPPLDSKAPVSGSGGNSVGGNVGQAFNKSLDHSMKNPIVAASSWSSLAAAGSPQSTPTSSNKPKPAMDSFQAFRNKAKEKADRQKMLEQQELRRSNKEAAEKRHHEQQKMKRDEVDTAR